MHKYVFKREFNRNPQNNYENHSKVLNVTADSTNSI